MGVKVEINNSKDYEYTNGCIVRQNTHGWYGILYITDVLEDTYNVLRFAEKEGYSYLYYTVNCIHLSDIQDEFEVVTDNKGYDLTLTLKGGN